MKTLLYGSQMAVLVLLLVFRLLPNVQSAARSGGTFKAGVAASLTGKFSEWRDAVNGYKLWADAVAAAGGIAVRDKNGTTYTYGIDLVVLDDNSTAQGHVAAVDALLNIHKVHFVLGASLIFTEVETERANKVGRLSIQCCAGTSSIYSRDQKNVFGISVDNALYTSELITEFRSKDLYKLAVIYRDDVLELRSACEGVVSQAQTQLLTVVLELHYSDSSGGSNTTTSPDQQLAALMDTLADSSAEALIMCALQDESNTAATMIDQRRKPLKAIVFMGGAYNRRWNDRLGNLSVGVLSFAHWAPDLINRKDNFWGDSKSYAGKYQNAFNDTATHIAAAASATGYVLQTVLSEVFRSCDLSPEALADPSVLLFTPGAIACSDTNNRGHDRLLAALSTANMDTFYGAVNFDRFRQNHGYSPVILQTYEISESLMRAYKPSVVLPLSAATRPLLLPQPNRYALTCQPGTHRGEDDFQPCIECRPGQFQEFPGRTSCELCPKDHFANASAMPVCLACPYNTLTIQRGSTNLTECLCKLGYYNSAGLPGLPCEPCPANALCEGGTSLPVPLPGFYADRRAPFQMYRCNPASVCTGNFTCQTGYRGRMCYACGKGYFRFLGNCVPCPRNKSNVLGYLIILASLWILINVWFARAVENLMVIVNFCQLMSIVLYQVMSLSSILSFEIDSLEPTCLVPEWGFAHNLVVQLLLPLIMTLLVGIWIGATYLIYRFQQARLSRSARQAASMQRAHSAPWKQVLWDMLDIPTDRRELQSMYLERWAVPLNFLNIGFLVQLKYNLNTFSCTTINGVKYMSASPNDECYTRKHWNLMMLGLSGVVVYNFGFICLYAHVMRQVRKYRALGDRRPLLLYGWMYERYEAQFCWYETVNIFQRITFVLVALFSNDPALQALLCMVISVAVLLLDVRTSAYMDKRIYMLQAIIDGVMGALLVAGLLFYNPLSEPSVARGVEFLLFSAVIVAFASAVVSIIEALATRFIIMWLMSKHRPIAAKIGQRVKGYRHVYHIFGPIFLIKCAVLVDYVHPTSDVSYLSLKKSGRFWRYLLGNFPEIIGEGFEMYSACSDDYLVSVQEEQREQFNSFIEVMYDHFFDTKDEHQHQVYYYIHDKFKAPFAQWLSSCEDDDRVMRSALEKAKGVKAASELSAAMNRSKKIASAVTVLAAIDKFKRGGGNAGGAAGRTFATSVRFQNLPDLDTIARVSTGGALSTSSSVTAAFSANSACSGGGPAAGVKSLLRVESSLAGDSAGASESGTCSHTPPRPTPLLTASPVGSKSAFASLAGASTMVAAADDGKKPPPPPPLPLPPPPPLDSSTGYIDRYEGPMPSLHPGTRIPSTAA
ncbi:hypothetical protein VOLCADRAFT_99335 [Volvox carteri f. nagariensis]|uniref:Receptor ligand binding region domain-containing protein n=1 Tax=Volvox carteri f. nagariensis TaxID=3068 RepID=D8UHJ7_VOLCA|nr:uncharacterized protein VOLCADRAFT_99335 [Volvox carteri f. nagariensis]EFJ40756.1 hypothetical protein VOLCADRAFT_99335 [Volvox carteri f. nagariensis]|eukprot:XP_002958131.1 hypothetical protein VOLCADRAFT_99335 [Volvox carteri f. nagariensis]